MTGPAVRIENLHYTYPRHAPGGSGVPPEGADAPPALRDVNLTVQPGEFVAVMGAVGAGKTTLCLALTGLVPQSTGGIFGGNVWIGSLNTRHHPVAEMATRVGIVFQESESQLFCMTVEDEVAFGPESLGLPPVEIEARIARALSMTGMSELRLRSPAGLSGGQQQRLALAAILAMQPAVLVMDEPTAGLDPLGRATVLEAVGALRRAGMAVLVATQDAEAVAALADRVVVLQAGSVALDGSPESVFDEVARLHALGVHVPQSAELSACLGISPPWLTVEQAAAELKSLLDPLDEPLSPPTARTWHLPVEPPSPSPVNGQSHIPPLHPATDTRRSPHAVRGNHRVAGEEVCSASIVFEGVGYQYADGTQALNGIDLAITSGEYVALIGANGSGKTTLARHINGLLRPSVGRVTVTGCDTRRTTTGALAHRVGYVFQNPDHQIFAPTVRAEIAFGPQNLGLARSDVERRVAEALEAFELTALADLPPAALGYGVRRLVTLASVHAMQPQVLVLDEPTAGLDRTLTACMIEWVRLRHTTGAAVVFITHDMTLAALAPRCVILAEGQVAFDGPTSDAFARPELLARCSLAAPPMGQIAHRVGMASGPPTVTDLCCRLLSRFSLLPAA